MFNTRYNDYYLVNENEIDLEEALYPEMVDKNSNGSFITKKCIFIIMIIIAVLISVAFILVFIIFPLIFMNNISLQRMLVFTHFDLHNDQQYFEQFRLPGYQNKYVEVKDLDGKTNRKLGVWHILPVELTYLALHNPSFDYNESLRNSNYSVLLYFHGTGEDRSDSRRKYQLLRYYFHVIAFDYRGYGDSSGGVLSENAVVNDCIQLYHWLKNNTNSSIYIWGHSLGAALATSTIALSKEVSAKGLILEAPFTSFEDELYVHPYGKLFSWLPWFRATILNPLKKNGFVFNTIKNIENVNCPVMLLHAKDDPVVPYQMSRKLFEVVYERQSNTTVLHLFDKDLQYKHNYIYQDPYLEFYLMDFMLLCDGKSFNGTVIERI